MSSLLLLVYVALFALVIWWVLVRPQQQRRRAMQDLQSRLKVGDDVVTTAGIYGRVTAIEDDATLLIEVAEETDVRIARNAVGEIVDAVEAESSNDH